MRDEAANPKEAAAEAGWMKMALKLAAKGRASSSPNPMVGAVVVSPSGEVVGRGWHRSPGKRHAEAIALEQAGSSAKGATLFVNLEPCAHHGRTPPCTGAIVRSGIARVVCSMEDPDPRVRGAGISSLRQAGVRVDIGLLRPEAQELNREYMIHRLENRPYVTLKMAASLDGKTSAADGTSRWITSEAARLEVHRLRAGSDAVCVGVGTVLADDPSLLARIKTRRQPCRVVFDSLARTPPEAKVMREGIPTLILTSPKAPAARLRALEKSGAECVVISSDSRMVSLEPALSDLAERSVVRLLLEGGPRLAASFLSAGLVDRFLLYLAPRLLGGPAPADLFSGWQADSIGDARKIRIATILRRGPDIRIEAFPEN